MIQVVLDTNVIISGLVFFGPPRLILKHVIEGDIKLCISEEIIDEVKGLLEEKKFKYTPEITAIIRRELISIAKLINPRKKLKIVEKDPKDNMVLECALEGQVNYIVSGDTHLLELKRFQDITIVKPSDFIKILKRQL